jgi:glycosyltransferase involved in cell wall biosynthesis
VITVSVIIPTYNRCQLLLQTLRSLAVSDFAHNELEIVVADDGSNDESLSRVAGESFPFTLTYTWQQDLGFRVSAARNMGLRQCRGRYVILLDCGIAVGPNFVSAHVEALRSVPGSATIGYVHAFANDERHDQMLRENLASNSLPEVLTQLRTSGHMPDIREAQYRWAADDLDRLPAPWAIAWSGNLGLDTQSYKVPPRFDENFVGWGGEDLDFALGLHQTGTRFRLVRSADGVHLPHSKSEESNNRSSAGNKQYLHRKRGLPETDVLQTTQSVDLNARLLNLTFSDV